MTRKIYILVLVVTGIFLTSNCGLMKKSPSDVVKSAYMAANKGEYSEADKYLSSEILNALKNGLGAVGGGSKGTWDRYTQNGTIEKIEILNEEIRGEGAKVSFKLYFKDGSTKDSKEPLRLENGEWKITSG